MRTPVRCSGSNCRWRAFVEALAVTAFLFSIVFLIACTPPKIHNHVLDPETPESLETTAPTWVEEFANSMATVDGPQPHVLLISLDTLRADHLGAWGYDRPTSPFLDELARFGVRFDQAFSNSPTTAPSHMSVFTGAFPSDHGGHIELGTTPPTAFPVHPSLTTLPEIMKNAGYRTAAWTGGGQMTAKVGFARGFDSYEENLAQLTEVRMEAIRAWFQRNSDAPCFLFLHTYQIHDPYLPPVPYNTLFTSADYRGWVIGDRERISNTDGVSDHSSLAKMFWRTTKAKPDPGIVGQDDRQQLIDLYDGGIRYTDDVFGGFLKALRDDKLLDNTLVVFFSDHGEEFLEHGGLLHEKLYQETLRVPLIFFWPGRVPSGGVVEAKVPLMDLTPTLLELVDITVAEQTNARSLLPLFDGAGRGESRLVFSENPWLHRRGPERSIRNVTHTLYDRGRGDLELYSTESDPLEVEDQSKSLSHLASALFFEMESYLEFRYLAPGGRASVNRGLTEDEIEALRALGYVE